MISVIKIIIPLLVGAIIGYVTNDIAIKMLFHPRKAYYIGKVRVPFTPGLIPKEQSRIARSLGNAVSTQLLNSEIVLKSLTSDEMLEKIRTGVNGIIDRNRDNEATIEEVLARTVSGESLEKGLGSLKKGAVNIIQTKIMEFDFTNGVEEVVVSRIKEYIHTNPMLARMAVFIDDEMLAAIGKGIGEVADRMIKNHSGEIVENLVDKETDEVLNMRICDIISSIEEKLPHFTELAVSAYKKLLTENLSRIMDEINLAKIVQERIDSYDVQQLEDLIFGIMKKELNAIVYLGAFLGFLMGFVNILLNMLI
ncbi:MAG: DUF445 family protein [Lachnospiraceae bacterium]|nr:DUF445 family protein [Lachnospiraceae bacterium]